MGRELFLAGPRSSFKDSLKKSEDILHGLGANWRLSDELLRDKAMSRIDKSFISHPITTALQIALVDLLRSLGA